MKERATTDGEERAAVVARLPLFKVLLTVKNTMRASDAIRLYYLQRRLAEVQDMITHHEVRAAIPPASCTEVELFSEAELNWAAGYRAIASNLQLEINLLVGQAEMIFA